MVCKNEPQYSGIMEKFEKGILLRFGRGDYEDANESMCKLRQTGTFHEFLSEFERLMKCLPDWPEQALTGAFIEGLKEEIIGDVQLFRPGDLQAAIELDKGKDEQLSGARKSGLGPRAMQRLPPPSNISLPANRGVSNMTGLTSSPKRLSWEEMKRRRERNLCFNCDEKFTPGHRCKNNIILMIEIEGEMTENKDEDVTESPINDPQIYINALAGETGSRAMRLQGNINQQIVHVLVDSGSTLNFISPSIANRLHLPLVKCEPFAVKVANGERLMCSGRYEKVVIKIQGCHF